MFKGGANGPRLEVWKMLDALISPTLRKELGGNLRYAVAGGAAMAPEIAKFFIGSVSPSSRVTV